MNSAEILNAIRAKHNHAAVVSEVTIDDADWLERFDPEVRMSSSRRIDALMFQTLERTAIEIKVTRADFERDVWQKRAPWMRVTHRFVYAVPAGLIERPHYKCGLWWIHPDGSVEVKAKATLNNTPEPLPQQVVQLLAYRAAHTRTPQQGDPR